MRGGRPTQKKKGGRKVTERRHSVLPPPAVRPPPPATPVTPGPQVPSITESDVPPTTPPEPIPEDVAQESVSEIIEEPPAAEAVVVEPSVVMEVVPDTAIVEVELGEDEEADDEEVAPEPLDLHPDAVPKLEIPKIPEEHGGPPFRRRRQRVKIPSKRVVKLDRRRYMDYKVDLREILEEENVLEEHRANVLGTTWARGERTGINDAEDYVKDKLAEGVLSEAAAQRILAVLKRYTTKR